VLLHRFLEASIHGVNINQLRGMEGKRVKQTYADLGAKFGITWNQRGAIQDRAEREARKWLARPAPIRRRGILPQDISLSSSLISNLWSLPAPRSQNSKGAKVAKWSQG
jgi:hypothetical protein